MKKTTLLLAGVTFSAVALMSITSASADTTSSGTSNGIVGFVPNADPLDPPTGTIPVDPEIPGIIVTPPTNPETPTDPGFGLTLDTIPGFNFGLHPVNNSSNATYYTYPETITNKATGTKTYAPNYIQVTDNRAEGTLGWEVQLTQVEQFSNGSTDLKGAQMVFSGKNTVVNANKELAAQSANNTTAYTLTPGTPVNIFGATVGTGGGSNLLDFGTPTADNSTGETAPDGNIITLADGVSQKSYAFGDDSLNTGTAKANEGNSLSDSQSSIKSGSAADNSTAFNNASGVLNPNVALNVLAGTAKVANYQTTLNWALNDTPAAQ